MLPKKRSILKLQPVTFDRKIPVKQIKSSRDSLTIDKNGISTLGKPSSANYYVGEISATRGIETPMLSQ